MNYIDNIANQWQYLSIEDKKAVKQATNREEREALCSKLK